MTELPDGFELRGVYFYRSRDDRQTFHYFPGDPSPERGPSGEPIVTFLVTDQSAMLQLGTRWAVDSSLLESLRKQIADRFPDLNPALIRFTPAPLSVKDVALILISDDGQEEELQTVKSSGFPPYSAIFNVTLTAEQKARVASALNGRAGLLKVTYRSSLAVEVTDESTSTSDSSTDVSEAARERSSQTTFKLSSRATTTSSLPVERSTDVGSWRTGGANSAKIIVAPTVSSSTSAGRPAAAMISIGFDMKDVPVALVQVSWDEQATISSPVFSPVTVKGQTNKPISVNTFYTNGAPSYGTNHSAPTENELKLTPPDLGLALITIDANALRQAGATQAQIKVNYKPATGGVADEHVTRLRFGDWMDQWYVVTRSSSLGGTLEIEATQTNADGTVIKHPTITTDNVEIILSAQTR
jgi:hypothetical protein